MLRFATRVLSLSAVASAVVVTGCTASTDSAEETLSKDEAAAVGGKSDGVDWCERLDWYGDGVCDDFCPLQDQDCTGDECTVGAASTCGRGQQCRPGICEHWCAVGDPECCAPATCFENERGFCRRAECAPGYTCVESTDSCAPTECSPVLCTLYCEHGFDVDERGCSVCRCAPEASCPHPSEPGVRFVSEDPDECATVRFTCETGTVPFSGSCGCGCRPADCRESACDAGTECVRCWGGYACVPDGAVC